MEGKVTVNVTSGRNIMWMVPRTVSTAITKSMSRVPDIEVWIEPFGFASLAGTCMDSSLQYEGNESAYDIAGAHLRSLFNIEFVKERLSYPDLKRAMEQTTSKYVFVKDESFAMREQKFRDYIPEGYRHSFLIRHPVLVYSSGHVAAFKQYRDMGLLLEEETDDRSFDLRNHKEFVDADVLFKSLHSLWQYVRENIDPNPIVMDSSDFLMNPAEMLPKYCDAIGIPFNESLLDFNITLEDAKKWKWPGEDLIHNKNYLDVSMSSSTFHPPKKPLPRDQLTDDVIELSDKAMPYYQEMYENRMTI